MKSVILSSKIIHQNPFFRVLHDRVRLPNGSEIDYYARERPDGAIVICERDRKLLVVKQDRHRADVRLVEFPAGTLNTGETTHKLRFASCVRKRATQQKRSSMSAKPGFSAAPTTMSSPATIRSTPVNPISKRASMV
jgi:hypothetical protein